MINLEGEREDETTEVVCSLKENVSPLEGQSLQGDFECSIAVTEEYYSLRLNSSNDIAGIPDDEVLLDPRLTEDAILNEKLLDYALPENQSPDKIPATFSTSNIKEDSCKSTGKFLIEGTLSKEITNELRFTIPLTYPDGISADCYLLTKEKGQSQISCQVDRSIDGTYIIFEQMVIKDGAEEIMNIEGFSSTDNITCANGLLDEAEKKLDVKVSFRQVSHLESNGVNGFNFFFAAFANANLNAGHKVTLKIYVLIGESKKEKEAECILQNDVQIQEGKQVQGNYKCQAKLEEEEYKQIEFNNTEAIKVATNNPEVGGLNDEDGNLSPLETDISINETNNKIEANETMTDLGECLDYSIEENINKEPTSLEITSVSSIQQCHKGKVILKGKFSNDIEKEYTFELPLSYPQTRFKCKVDSAKKDEEVEFTCRTQQKFKLVKQFVIEPRLLKKKFKEELFIKSNKFDLSDTAVCEDFNELKYQRTKIKQKADISFLQLSNFRPNGPKFNFFFGAIKTSPSYVFQRFTIIINVRIQVNALRQLEESSQEVPVTCELKGSSDTAGGFDCSNDGNVNGTPLGMEVSEDSPIAGLPDPADPQKIPVTVDYSDVSKLQEIDNLPTIKINNDGIDGSNCEETGDYTIDGTIENNGKLEDLEGIDIPFSSPDSVGRCDLKVDGKNVHMNCHNKEKFTASPILFEQNIIKDSEGNALFVLQNYTNLKSFACALSVNSVAAKYQSGDNNSTAPGTSSDTSSDSSKGDSNSENMRHYYKNSESGGLKGGAIAALVIAIIAAIAIFVGVLFYCKKNTKPPMENSFNNSTIDKIAAVPNTNNF